jgi:hypothetical protein
MRGHYELETLVRATIVGGGILTFIYYENLGRWRDCGLR